MIILTQKGNEIIDTNRITGIRVDGKIISVYDNALKNSGYIIAQYHTEERAKEVFKAILYYTSVFNLYKNASYDARNEMAKDFKNDNVAFDVYEMPKE